MDGASSVLLICSAAEEVASGAILLEDGSEVLLEDGASALLAE